MRHVVMFSGGVTSFFAAQRVLEHKAAKDDVVLLFADTRMEDEDLYRFLNGAERYFSLAITRIADGRTPWEVFRDVKFLGNSRIDPCSRLLKRELLDRWVREHCTIDETILSYGLHWEEMHRITRLRERLAPWHAEFPLCGKPYKTKTQLLDDLARIGIAIPRLYQYGMPHNNCGGFCIKAGQAQFARLYAVMPERYHYHERQEEALRATLGDVSILRDRRHGTSTPLTLRQFRLRYLEGILPVDIEEWGGVRLCN